MLISMQALTWQTASRGSFAAGAALRRPSSVSETQKVSPAEGIGLSGFGVGFRGQDPRRLRARHGGFRLPTGLGLGFRGQDLAHNVFQDLSLVVCERDTEGFACRGDHRGYS